MLIGAVNAFNEQTNSVRNIETGQYDAVPATARDYKARGLRWVVVGDENYGEGSSREHAAMEPRHLGCAAVIVRSFARIHETNLKKQGILPLTFINPADYDLVQEGDRFDLTGLADLAPGSQVGCTLHHADGQTDTFALAHTMTGDQIDWFRAGSALNEIKAANRG
jgi:aconitate hydratase